MLDILTRKHIAIAALVIISLTLISQLGKAETASPDLPTLPNGKTIEPGIVRTKPEIVEGEILVRYREGLLATKPFERAERIYSLAKLVQNKIPDFHMTVIATYPSLGIQRIGIPQGVPLKRAIQLLEPIPEIQFIEPNYKIYPLFSSPPHDEHWTIDSLHMWGMNRIGMKRAWGASKAGAVDNIIVAVIDTGIAYTHPDLQSQMWTNPSEDPAVGATKYEDDDNNGIRDDIHGVNYCWWTNESPSNPTGTPFDNYSGHGTAVAGVIGAKVSDAPVISGNSSYVAGVHRNAKLMALKIICDPREQVDSTVINAALAIDYAWMHGATVLNASWYVATGTDTISPITGGSPGSQVLRDAIARARDHNALFITAAGNSSDERDNDLISMYPANYGRTGTADYLENVIAVAATWDACPGNRPVNTVAGSQYYGQCDEGSSPQEALWEQSHYGLETVQIAAPGWNTYTTMPLSLDPVGVTNSSGTSMAAPYVSGCAALLQAKLAANRASQPFTPSDLKDVLINSADSIGIAGIRNGLRLNCDKALEAEMAVADQTPPPPPPGLVVR